MIRPKLLRGIALAACGSLIPGSLSAAEVDYIGTGGSWNRPTSWSTGTVPVVGDDVNVVNFGSKNIAVDLNVPYEIPGLGSLTVDGVGGGLMTINSTKNLVVSGTAIVGDNGEASFNLKKGNVTFGDFVMGRGFVSPNSTFTMKKGTLQVLGQTVIGSSSQAAFTQRNGSTQLLGDLIVGETLTGEGSFTVNKGTVSVGGTTQIGLDGAGYLTQKGGTFTQNDLVVGINPTGFGVVTLERGTMTTSTVDVGVGGGGFFRQTGGVHNIAGDINITVQQGSEGYYGINRGDTNVAGSVFVGVEGSGTLDILGGKMTVENDVIAGTVTSSSTVELLKGRLEVKDTFDVVNASVTVTDFAINTGSLLISADSSFTTSGESKIRVSEALLFEDGANVSLTGTDLVIANDSEVRLSIDGDFSYENADGITLTGLDIGSLTLETGVVLSLEGNLFNELIVDVFDIGFNNLFRLDSLIMGNGIDIYYNGDLEENRYLAGARYDLGRGGQLRPFYARVETTDTMTTMAFSPSPVPEPAAVSLILLGLGAIAGRRRQRR